MTEEEILSRLKDLLSDYEDESLTPTGLRELNECLKQMFYITADAIGPSEQYRNYKEEN